MDRRQFKIRFRPESITDLSRDWIKLPAKINRKLTTEHFRPRADLIFPYAAGRRSTTGLPEQMPRSQDRRVSARHVATPLDRQSNSAYSVRTREVEAILVIPLFWGVFWSGVLVATPFPSASWVHHNHYGMINSRRFGMSVTSSRPKQKSSGACSKE